MKYSMPGEQVRVGELGWLLGVVSGANASIKSSTPPTQALSRCVPGNSLSPGQSPNTRLAWPCSSLSSWVREHLKALPHRLPSRSAHHGSEHPAAAPVLNCLGSGGTKTAPGEHLAIPPSLACHCLTQLGRQQQLAVLGHLPDSTSWSLALHSRPSRRLALSPQQTGSCNSGLAADAVPSGSIRP